MTGPFVSAKAYTKLREGLVQKEVELANLQAETQSLVGERLKPIDDVTADSAYLAYKVQSGQAAALELDAGLNNANQQMTALVAAAEEMSAAIAEVSFSAETLHQQAAELNQATAQGHASIMSSNQEISAIDDHVTHLDRNIAHLKERIGEIVGVVEVIQGIADQTNLLALNAAIEAARAGDMGRGFAVVAEEVRKLAQETRAQSEGITRMISVANEEMQRTGSLMGQVVNSVAAGRAASAGIAESHAVIEQAVTAIGGLADATQAQLKEQRSATDVIVHNSEALAKFIHETAGVSTYLSESNKKCCENALAVWRAIQSGSGTQHVFILDRIVDHALWLRKMADLVTSRDMKTELVDHLNCKLGKWYASNEGRELGNRGGMISTLYRQLEAPHKQLHTLGLQALREARQGHAEQAQQLMIQAFEQSGEVVQVLLSLAEHVQAAEPAQRVGEA